MDLHLKIVESGDHGGCYWFLVRLTDAAGRHRFDEHQFRWAIQEFDGDEINVFDYSDIAMTATRHFLREQGLLPETFADGTPWQVGSHTTQGGQSITAAHTLSERVVRMKNARLSVTAADVDGTIKTIAPRRGY